jgi:hypothetical protein
MNTVKQTLKSGILERTENRTGSWVEKHVDAFEEARFGWMSMLITIQSCLGAIACMYVLQNGADNFQLVLCAMITMTCNAINIAQAPAKWCLGSFYLSVVVNAILVILNFIH